MRKNTFVLLLVVLAGGSSFAQSVDQGRKFFYYERYNSARDQFEKVLASNPNNLDAVYWLGQTMLQLKDSVSAKALYQKSLGTNGNSPLLLAGIGQIELMENKASDAKQRFETALSLSKGKDVNVLNAIARANVEAGPGDANYAIEKLNSVASEKKDPRNTDSYLLLAEANRKLINGGGAVTALQKVLAMDPKLAQARYDIGRVYQSQNNPEYFLPAYEQATQMDPNYAPAYFALFDYWYNRDINKAKTYFDKYLAVTDAKPSNEYDRISILFASRNFQGAVDSSKAKIAQLGDKADIRYYKLAAYSYDALQDSANAKTYLDQYFAKQTPSGFIPGDYVFRAKLLSKFPGNETEAFNSYQTAIQLDTAMQSKMTLISDAAAFASRVGNHTEQARLLGQIFNTKKEPTNRDLYDWGYANYQAGNFVTADSIFCGVYKTKYPTEVFGYLWCARSAYAQDTTMEKGLAVEPYKQLIAFADTAKDKYKGTLVQAHGYLASYYANVAKNKDSAVASLQQILSLDPENASAKQAIAILTRPASKSGGAPTKSSTKSTKTAATKPKSTH